MNNHSGNVVTVSEVTGKKVKDPRGEDLGTIQEIVLDKISGIVRYVVLSFGGFLGFGDKYFAFPWKSISYSPEHESFILNVNKEKLKQEYGFDKNNWPDMSTWPTTVDIYYE